MLTETEPGPQEAQALRLAVRILLAAKDQTQNDLAERLDLNKATLSRVLSGRLHRPDVWKRIWQVLTTDTGARP